MTRKVRGVRRPWGYESSGAGLGIRVYHWAERPTSPLKNPRLVSRASFGSHPRRRLAPAHDVIGALNPGLEVEALGISPEGDYLMIRDPALPFGLGWIRYNPSTV